MKKIKLYTTAILMTAVTISFNSFSQMKKMKMHTSSAAADDLRTNMRKLWEDHVTWTRNVILNIMDDLPGTNEAVQRLLQNQTDIGNAIKPVYGEEAGKKLTELLRVHITTAADLLKAAKAGNTTSFNE